MTSSRPLYRRYAYRALTLIFLMAVTLTMSAQWASQEEEGGIPAYNAGPPPKDTKLPAIMSKAELWGADARYPYQTHAYDLAAKIPTVLHQQPCYCYCQRKGHRSLLDCFKTDHAASCSICIREALLAAQMHRQQKSAEEIRRAITQGPWAGEGSSNQ